MSRLCPECGKDHAEVEWQSMQRPATGMQFPSRAYPPCEEADMDRATIRAWGPSWRGANRKEKA